MGVQRQCRRAGYPQPPSRPRRPSAGFTLIELVMVMVIVGVLAAYAMPRWAPDAATVPAQSERLARDIRHLQAIAMNEGRTLSLLANSSGYRIADSSGNTVQDPITGQPLTTTLDNGVTLAGPAQLDFDSLGRPASGGTLLGTAQTYTLSGGGNSATVTVSPVTGFPAVSP